MIQTDLSKASDALTAMEVSEAFNVPIILTCAGTSESVTSDVTSDITTPPSPTSSVTTVFTEDDLGDGLIDPTLAQAAISALETGSITPILKQELRCAIQSKRLSEGKDELPEQDAPKPAKKELTPEEEERRRRRRERNKIAAQKCRSKKRELAESLQEETETLESANKELRNLIASLKDEKDNLMRMLRKHDKSTQCDTSMLKCAKAL